jgi:hypothetical protein
MAIPVRVRECFDAFLIQCNEQEEESHLQDELGRFKVWVGNIAAHMPPHSRRSLEYRLRDSSRLRETVLLLLHDLKIALYDSKEQMLARNVLVAADGPSKNVSASNFPEEAEPRATDDEFENEDKFELSDEESIDEGTLVRQASSEVHDVTTCLLRFSMTLRNPSRDDQRRDDPEGFAEAFVNNDTEHVRAKYPAAPEYLTIRLGKTLSKRRQYFRYRREHQRKFHVGLDEVDTGAGDLPSTVATSLPKDASDIQNSIHLATGTDETESAYTATSYEGTSTGNAILCIPPRPVSAQAGSPFECPICFGIIEAESETSWRRHVFEDLPPYVCLDETCASAVKSFSRRREWVRHNDTMHDKLWVCPYADREAMRSPSEIMSHLEQKHPHSMLSDTLPDLIAARGSAAESGSNTVCPLCTKQCDSAKRWSKHVGHHLEQLALFSLPLELFITESPDNGDVDEKDVSELLSIAASDSDDDLEQDGSLVGDPTLRVESMQAPELPISIDTVDTDPLARSATAVGSKLPSGDISAERLKALETDDEETYFRHLRQAKDSGVETPISSEPHRTEEIAKAAAIAKAEESVVAKKVIEVEKKEDPMAEEVELLRAMIKKQENERIAREEAIIAAERAKKLQAEQEALKAKEIAAAAAVAKADAKKAAEEVAKMTKEQSDKKFTEVEAAKVELEKKLKELEEAAAKNKPIPDMEKAPIKFKDAVGRKFSFPWHLCKTWKGMESLIKQAFIHVDVIGQHVQEGHYDLMGPDGGIILPQVWDAMIKPDWEVSMHMWPIPETPKKDKQPAEEDGVVHVDPNGQSLSNIFPGMSLNEMLRMDQNLQAADATTKAAKKSKKDKKKAAKSVSATDFEVLPTAPSSNSRNQPQYPPMSSQLQPMLDPSTGAQLMRDSNGSIIEVPIKNRPRKKKELTGFAAWMAGQAPKPSKKDEGKLELSTSSNHSHSPKPPASDS